MKKILLTVAIMANALLTQAQTVTTVAGTGTVGSTDGTGTSASFRSPFGVCNDASGNTYVADTDNNLIRKITTSGVVTVFAGSGVSGDADGAATAASFNIPIALCIDALGNIYVSDYNNSKIRKITPTGVVSTVAGNGTRGFTDGPAATAQFNSPIGICVDALGNIYVADRDNNTIRIITTTGSVSSYAGSGSAGNVDGAGTAARFNQPSGLCLDPAGNLFVTDYDNHNIRKVSTAGVVSTIAGNGLSGLSNGLGSAAQFGGPFGICMDAMGNFYIADQNFHGIRKMTPAGLVSSFAGDSFGNFGTADGVGSVARFRNPSGLSIDASGNLYVADKTNHKIRKITTCSAPTVSATTSNTLLCTGQTATLTASGATSYTWSYTSNTTSTNTVITVSPTADRTYSLSGTTASGCVYATTITQSVSVCTGINNLTSNTILSIYPNPSNGVFNVTVSSTTKVMVLDVLGKIIYTQTLEVGNHQINLSAYASGLFLLKAENNGAVNTMRLIKE